ncbi:MAG: bifunctional precorrin-2 dehydrogenase/sirohydrochlorin ferrochelatase [Nitrospinae bacterium]|nr:bifunctional precorrin-2 dehydrogenase/sirohydrochlorin ferrochelatase [Nitrospinota bacterium]
MPGYYPAYLDIKEKKCLVVGGGEVAERKVGLLIRCGAKVSVVSPDLTPGLEKLNSNGGIDYVKDEFKEDYLFDVFLAIGATDKKEINERIYREAKKRNILVNVVDSPELCNFIVPSVVERGDLIISISTCGKSPALSKKIREELEDRYGIEYAKFLNLMGDMRKRISLQIADKDKREDIYKRLVCSDIIDLIRNGDDEAVKNRVDEIMTEDR